MSPVEPEASLVWYVQKGTRVLGPFSEREVRRFVLLGRVRVADRVSLDRERWEPVTQVPELVPEELLSLAEPPPPRLPPPPPRRPPWREAVDTLRFFALIALGWAAAVSAVLGGE